jgi:hypothetical protein
MSDNDEVIEAKDEILIGDLDEQEFGAPNGRVDRIKRHRRSHTVLLPPEEDPAQFVDDQEQESPDSQEQQGDLQIQTDDNNSASLIETDPDPIIHRRRRRTSIDDKGTNSQRPVSDSQSDEGKKQVIAGDSYRRPVFPNIKDRRVGLSIIGIALIVALVFIAPHLVEKTTVAETPANNPVAESVSPSITDEVIPEATAPSAEPHKIAPPQALEQPQIVTTFLENDKF